MGCITIAFFKKKILVDMSSFCGGTNTPVLDFSGDVSCGFQSQIGQLYSHLPEAYVLHVPLVRHLLTSWWLAWQLSLLFHIPARHWWYSKPGTIMPPLTRLTLPVSANLPTILWILSSRGRV